MKNSLKKESYSLKFFMKRVMKASPGYVAAASVAAALEAALPFIPILLPKYMIDEMMGAKRLSMLAGYVGIAALTAFFLSVSANALKRYMKAATRDILVKFEEDMGSHNMGVAYSNLEDTRYIELKDRAMFPIRERMTHFTMVQYLPALVRYLLTALGTLGILLSFDVVSLIVLLIPTLLITQLNAWYQKKDMEIQKKSVGLERFFMYYYTLIEDFSPAKDIRLFRLHELLMKRNNQCDDQILGYKKQSLNVRHRFEGGSKVMESFQSAFIYGYIGIKSLLSATSIGNFTMYVSAASTFSNAVSQLLSITIQLRQDCRYLEEFVKLQEVPVETEKGGAATIDTRQMCLEFSHVFFRYPGTGCDVLRDLSFQIHSGDSLSIVGRNGAGKTTIIKLLSRLFKPTSGNILINGMDIQTIDASAYQKLLSVVFQDFKIFEFTVAENVAAGASVDEDHLRASLTSAGIMDKINSLESGSAICVGKQFDKNGTEFSGGELQKLAIARALYKNAPIIVLDEPTAALDPYAEEEVYQRFQELTGGRTTIYISHRLSSCKFCKRIIFIDDGRIEEDGSHEELMKLGGKYAAMFQLQADQYIA